MMLEDLNDAEFLKFVKKQCPEGPVQPDGEDYSPTASSQTDEERADQYRLAQASKLMRLHRQWRAGRS
jgi:hypothetical protein